MELIEQTCQLAEIMKTNSNHTQIICKAVVKLQDDYKKIQMKLIDNEKNTINIFKICIGLFVVNLCFVKKCFF